MIKHYGFGGKRLTFGSAAGVYPVNRYQSLFLASAACLEGFIIAASMGKRATELRTVELCCGGGPVAVTLKAAGFGTVDAVDIDKAAVDLCLENARANNIELDLVETRDIFAPHTGNMCRYDLVAINPPCSPDWGLWGARSLGERMRVATSGGGNGEEFTVKAILALREWLTVGGSLVFVMTSTQDFRSIASQLNRVFPSSWRLHQGCPVAQPFLRRTSALTKTLDDFTADKRILSWDGGDGWNWRLSWIVVAERCDRSVVDETVQPELWFLNFGYDVPSPNYRKLVKSFQAQ